MHWPERECNYFGKLGFVPLDEEQATPIEETLAALGELVAAGKVRAVGVSNETPWGLMRYLQASETLNLPRVACIQNPYNLLNRSFEVGLAEIAWRERVGLLAYSPLAFGVLSGKYLHGARPPGSRLALFPDYNRYTHAQGQAATEAYVKLAREHSLDPAQMALAFVLSRPFLTAAIVGATKMEQLRSNIAAAELRLPPQVMDGIEAIHARYTFPCP